MTTWCALCFPVHGRMPPRRALPIADGAPAYCIECLNHTYARLAAAAAEPEVVMPLGAADSAAVLARAGTLVALSQSAPG